MTHSSCGLRYLCEYTEPSHETIDSGLWRDTIVGPGPGVTIRFSLILCASSAEVEYPQSIHSNERDEMPSSTYRSTSGQLVTGGGSVNFCSSICHCLTIK